MKIGKGTSKNIWCVLFRVIYNKGKPYQLMPNFQILDLNTDDSHEANLLNESDLPCPLVLSGARMLLPIYLDLQLPRQTDQQPRSIDFIGA